ncbi:hypothetical protein EAE96_008439 [Botrytis aclada]|nr:hypothetical protein EAE96_008439 [Botrytis aclada]
MRFSVIAVSIFAGAAMAATSTDYVTEEVTITSCAATVTDCPARSTQVSTTIYSRTSSTEASGSSVTPAGQPSNSAPVASGPASSAPASSAPVSSAPGASSPAPSAPASSAPGTLVPVASAPGSSAPVASAPASSAPVASAPGSSAPVASAPASSKPAGFTPTYATPAASSAGSSLGVVVSSPAPSVSVVAITTCIPTVIYSTVTLSGHETTAPGVPASSAKPSSTGYVSVPSNGTTPSATQTPMAFTGAAANVQVGGAAIAAVFGLAALLL